MTHKMNYEDKKKSIKIEIKSMKVETWKPKKKESFNIWRAFNFFIENESGKDGGQITYRMYFR
jgi:hypothetical protein